MRRLSNHWKWFLLVAVIAGTLLRLLYVQDMEYKEDEEYNFTQSQLGGWPWIGMPSGVFIPNPGMSVWVFSALARLIHATEPTALARGVQVFAIVGICLVLPFVLRVLRPTDDRRPWLWAMALALVNPFAVFYQRKLWPEPFLPLFSMLMLAGWWRRELWTGAFAWGLVGAWLGQIHMSGFFYAAGFFLFTLIFASEQVPRARVKWGAWFLGSVLGALPLIPWVVHVLQHPTGESVGRGWEEIAQLKFWVFWMTDPLGLHLGNPLGLLRGQTLWSQISDFVRYPLVAGHPTYLCLAAHVVVAVCAAAIYIPGLLRWLGRFRHPRSWLLARPDLRIALAAAIWGFGLLLTASSVVIRRYYLMVSFPLEFVWISSLALDAWGERARKWLALLWVGELLISAFFVTYIHINEGSITGDYGEAYHVGVHDKEIYRHMTPEELRRRLAEKLRTAEKARTTFSTGQ
jgi:hypothetical protein